MNMAIGGVEFDGLNKQICHPPAPVPASRERLASADAAAQKRFQRLLPIDPAAIAVIVLAGAAVGAWLLGGSFALGVHYEDAVKVQTVLTGRSTYLHPLLMIDLVRAANAYIGLTDPQSVVELGRAFSAVAGGLLIVATFVLARLVQPPWTACAATAATLATPLVTVHARYFKEDIFVAPFVVLALAALIAVLRAPTLIRTMALGAAIGLAGGAKYVGVVILLPYALIVVVAFGRRERIGTRLTDAGIVALTALAVFTLIEIPALLAMQQFLSGIHRAFEQAVTGRYDLVLPITLTWGVFHLRESLWPGLAPPLTVLGMFGLSAPFLATAGRRQPLAVIAGFAVAWYLAHEISPFKAYPDFARYMVPLAPLLVILAAAFINECAERYRFGVGATATIVALIVAAVPAGWLSLRVNAGAFDDPRRLLPEILANAPGRVAVDGYAGYQQTPFLAQREALPTAADTLLVVTSSFSYDRYKRYGALPQQPMKTREAARFFAQALALPHLDVSNGDPSFGFFNPTTTIIAMDGNAAQLLPIAKMIETTAPSMVVRWSTTMDGARAGAQSELGTAQSAYGKTIH